MANTPARPEWFYDFVSPFAYLQLEQLEQLPLPSPPTLTPVVLGALLTHWGNKGPAEIPAKRLHTYRMAQWRAEQLGIPFRMPPAHPFNPIRPLRLALAAGGDLATVRTIFRFIWREGRGVWDEADWCALCERIDLPEPNQAIEAQAVKDALRRNTAHAIELGVFGVPTLYYDHELFWGEDATGLVRRHLQDPHWLRSDELARLARLPVGIERK